MARLKSLDNWCTILLFLLLLAGPGLAHLFTPDAEVSESEGRKLATAPEWTWDGDEITDWPLAFDAYFNDQFRPRSALLERYTLMKYRLFKASPSDKVVVGADDWHFLAQSAEWMQPLSEVYTAAWARQLDKRRNWLAERGVAYVFVVVPGKSDVYPEFTPGKMARHIPEETRIDTFGQRMSEMSQTPVLNLAPALRAAKDQHDVYYRYDTHWNYLGSWYGYAQIMNHLSEGFPQLKPLPVVDFNLELSNRQGGGLGRMMGLQEHLWETSYYFPTGRRFCALKKEAVAPYTEKELPRHRIPFARKCGEKQLKLLMIRDSFASAMEAYLSEHFRESVFIWDQPSFELLQQLVEREQPDIVIEERTARLLLPVPL